MIRQHVVRGTTAPVAVGLLLLVGLLRKRRHYSDESDPQKPNGYHWRGAGGEAYGGASSDGDSV